jgi:hypothetical protein
LRIDKLAPKKLNGWKYAILCYQRVKDIIKLSDVEAAKAAETLLVTPNSKKICKVGYKLCRKDSCVAGTECPIA